jgi:hypothetical protein
VESSNFCDRLEARSSININRFCRASGNKYGGK